MADKKELSLVDAEVLTPDEKTELNAEIDRIIEAHKANRKEINRLVFESVSAMTEADEAGATLAGKGFFSRFIGGLTGSNQKLQNKINSSRAAAQYASQQTLQKLAEQNLMSFDLIAAVNNKLNASMQDIAVGFNQIYEGLGKFFQYNQSQLVRLEMRLAKVERNVNLLTWQNSIEYLEYEGKEYSELDDAQKIVCLVRDFYDITKGEYSTSDMLLLKAAMSSININPKGKVNYGQIIEEIAADNVLQDKLLGGARLKPIEDPRYLISMGSLQKLDALHHEESYTVDTVENYLTRFGASVSRDEVCSDLTKDYMNKRAGVNLNLEVENFDMVLDLLYALNQVSAEQLLEMPQSTLLTEAENLFIAAQYEKAFPLFSRLAEEGNGRAMYYLGEYYGFPYAPADKDEEKAKMWREKGAQAGDVLAALKIASSSDEKQLFQKVLRLAEDGDVTAQFEVGKNYYWGTNTVQDYEKAVVWYRKAAEAGNARAQNNLGNCYYEGEGVKKDFEEAVKWYKKAAEQGNANAQNNLGERYYYGQGVEQNYEEAVKWYRKSAEQGNADAQNNLGERYYYGQGVEQNYEEAMKWCMFAAEQGNEVAMCDVGFYYENGYGAERNIEEAVKWYRKSAELGNSYAQNNLGICYYNGNGVEQSYEEAVKWYARAAEQGHTGAQDNLGDCYFYGNGVDQSYEEAVKWYQKAAEQGYNLAQKDLGFCYANGYGVSQDYEKAAEWYQRAAEQGNAYAQNELGACYYNGNGVEKDYEKAAKWYQKAAEQGIANAQNMIGICYHYGYGVEQDYKKEVYWLRKAADQGYDWAQNNLGNCYKNGWGVQPDQNEAIEWYKKAARQDNQSSIEALRSMGILFYF